jgi:hypothetical protein
MPGFHRQLLERVPVIAGFLVVSGIFLTGALHRGTVLAGWEQLKVPMNTWGPWEDSKFMAYNVDCTLNGANPYRTVCAPGDRAYNYPPIWLKLNHLGVHAQSGPALGWILASLTVLSYLLVLRTRTMFSALCVLIAIIPANPLLLALERGNSDQAILFLLTVTFFVASRLPQSRQNLLRGATVICLTVLKIYPVATAISLLRGRRGIWMVLGCGVASVALLIRTAGYDLVEVFHETPSELVATFGVIPALYWAGRLVHLDLASWVVLHRTADFCIGVTLFACFAALGALSPERVEQFLPPVRIGLFRDSLALACTGIYCFAFVGGANYDYRLIFLIPVLARLLQAFDAGQKRAVWFSVVIVVYMVIPFVHSRPREAFDVLLFAAFAAWLGAFAKRELYAAPLLTWRTRFVQQV